MTFDVEAFRDYFLGLLQDNMLAKITAINTEKGDNVLTDIPAARYASGLNEKVMNFERFIVYGFPSIESPQAFGKNYAQDITMSFEIAIEEANEADNSTETLVMRYTRAMAEIIAENSTEKSEISDIEIGIFSPVELIAQDGSLRIAGITVKGTIVG